MRVVVHHGDKPARVVIACWEVGETQDEFATRCAAITHPGEDAWTMTIVAATLSGQVLIPEDKIGKAMDFDEFTALDQFLLDQLSQKPN